MYLTCALCVMYYSMVTTDTYVYIYKKRKIEREKKPSIRISMTSTSTYIVQIASVPGNQVGQREFEQNRYLHDLLVATLINRDDTTAERQQIKALTKIIPQHEIVLRSGFSQTAQWGLEPNMFLEVSELKS